MEVEAWTTLLVVLAMLFVLARELAPPPAVVLAATGSLLLLGVIDEQQAFAGFSNPAPLTVAALYVLAGAAEKTGLLGPLVGRLLGRSSRIDRRTVFRLLAPTASVSAFFNNTPLVGMLIPEIQSWAARRGASASRLLLPLSYAAILGGTLTVIGTSTNLVVSGLLEESGREPLSLFEVTPISAAAVAVGLLLLITVVWIRVPDRQTASASLEGDLSGFSVEMVVDKGGRLEGESVEGAGLRHLEGVYLVEIGRNSQTIAPVPPETRLRGGDRLTFVGRADLVVDLQRTRGLSSTEDEHLFAVDRPGHTFFEAVIGLDSPLAGQTLRETDFRARYQAAVVAIHRQGEPVREKLGQVRLQPGDALLLLAGPDFRVRWRGRRDFLMAAMLGGQPPSAGRRAPLVGGIAIGMVLLAALQLLPILQAALLAAAALLLTRVLTFNEARNAIDLNVVVLIAAAFGIGTAIETTGLANTAADGIIGATEPFGDVGIILGVVLCTLLLTELITNNAAAVVVFPIGISVALAAELDPRLIAIAIAITASASFLTPLGYQTNTMVYGAGGYRFGDYLRAGLPMSIAVVVAVTAATWALA